MKLKNIIYLLSVCFVMLAFQLSKDVSFETPKNWPQPNYDFKKNPLTTSKIELGRALFYDPILSRNNTISCSSCHSQYSAFTHIDHALSHGIEDKIGTRNSPALMNLAWQKLFMHDGAVNHLDVQSLSPITNALEMDETLANVVSKLQKSKTYPKLFYKAFKDSTITGRTGTKKYFTIYAHSCFKQFKVR